jgi:hypothetical protein
VKYSRLPSSKPSEASVFQSSRNQKGPKDCEEWQLTRSGPIDGTNRDAPVFTSGLHLAVPGAFDARLVHVQHAVRFKPGEIQSALPCFVGLPFASGEAIRRLRSRACHDPHDPTPRSPSRRLITLFSCIRPDVPIRTLECPIGCLYPSTSAAPSGMKTAPKCAPGKRKEKQQQVTESERNVIASDIRPRQGHRSPATGRDHIHCDSVCHHRFYV